MRLSGGRTWWAHFEFTRINIEPIILRKKIEDFARGGRFSIPDRLRSRLVPINAEATKKSLRIDTLYEQQSSAQSIPGDVACWGVFR